MLEFCEAYAVTLVQLARFEVDPKFWREMLGALEFFIQKRADVICAVYNNAIDADRKDQMVWVDKFLAVTGKDAHRNEISNELPDDDRVSLEQ